MHWDRNFHISLAFVSMPLTALWVALVPACGGRTEVLGGDDHGPSTGSAHQAGGGPMDGAGPAGPNEPDPNTSTGSGGSSGGTGGGGIGSGGTGGSALPVLGCGDVPSQQFDAANMEPYSVSKAVQEEVDALLAAMGPREKAGQMMGVPVANRNYRDINRSPDVTVPSVGNVRGLRYRDAGRGVNLEPGQDNRQDDSKNFSTAFPATSLRAASWDLDLERRVGVALGDETAASKNNVLLAPCMNVVRHPYWGRTQETYGEDSYLIGRMATALTVGIQQHVLACAKHFAANNIEKGRSLQDAVMSEQTLREVYGRHFEMVVQDAGVACVMAAYNSINGTKATLNKHLLRDVLKAPVSEAGMGFSGFVLSDWWAMPGDQNTPEVVTSQLVTHEAVAAGLDVEMPWQLYYSETTLGNADQQLIDEAAKRVLTQKVRFKTTFDTNGWGPSAPTSVLTDGSLAPNPAHEALAEEAALKSIVLLTNGDSDEAPVLPLADAVDVAVVGPSHRIELISSTVPYNCEPSDENQPLLQVRECDFKFATDPALGDRGTSRVNANPDRSFGPFAGIAQVAGANRMVTSGSSASDAASADTVVVVVGYAASDEGEEYPIRHGGDRSSLDLPMGHNEFVQSVLDLDKPTVIVVESGSIVNLPWLSHPNQKQATIWAGYPGQRGGLALGKLLFGEANFSGKMPMAWPLESELPLFKDSENTTLMGYFFGYRELDRRKYVEHLPVGLVFPFGHGLSYSAFEYSNLTVPCPTASKEAVFEVTVDITNTSRRDGDEVAMLFVKPPVDAPRAEGERPWKELKSFARIAVPAGKTVTARLPLRVQDLRRWQGGADGRWVIDSGTYTLLVGKNAADAETSFNTGQLVIEGD